MSLKRSSSRRKSLVERFYTKQNGECHWCKCKMNVEARANTEKSDDAATFDHLLPRSEGGTEKEDNLVLACLKCNARRGGKLSAPQFRDRAYTVRRTSQAAEELIDLYFPVHDHGFIALKDYMGTDECVEDAARTSYGVGTTKRSDTGGLIRYLTRHKHASPFEMAELKFHVGMPIYVARQWVRHRTASLNEYSGRYSLMPMMFHQPDNFSLQATKNKQGRSSELLTRADEEQAMNWLLNNRQETTDLYSHLINLGVSREQARIDLPLSTYTFWYWKSDLRNLFHFMGLRCDPHAQKEIRVYSDIMAGMVQRMFPHSYKAWLDYQFLSVTFTQEELQLLLKIAPLTQKLTESQIDDLLEVSGMSKGERGEFKDKLRIRERPDYNLNLSLAKTPEYFERVIQQHTIEV